MKFRLSLASAVVMCCIGLLPSTDLPFAAQAAAMSQTTEPQRAPEEAHQSTSVAQVKPDNADLENQFSYSILGKDVYASVSRAGMNGYRVTETPLNAALFMRVFEKNGHILAAFNYKPGAIASSNAGATAPVSGPYRITLSRSGAALATIDIKTHHAGQEWVWMNRPIAYQKTPMETGQYPRHDWQEMYDPYARTPTLIRDDMDLPKLTPDAASYTPLSVGRNVANWWATGKHDEVHWDIYTSAWILTGDDAYWGRVMEAALNQLAAPLHYFSKGGSTIPDLTTQRYARTYLSTKVKGAEPRIPQAKPTDSVSGRPLVTDTSHLALPQWEAYAMSGHPYFLYSAQQISNYAIWASRPVYRHKTHAGGPAVQYGNASADVPTRLVVDSEQQRALGKGLMALLRMWQLTPEDAPEWLHGKAYWAKGISDTAGFIKDVYGQAPAWKLGLTERNYYTHPRSSQTDTSFDFMDLQIHWAVYAALYAGFDEFRPIADHITLKTGEILDAIGAGHPAITKSSEPGNDVNFDTWHDYAAYMKANPKKFMSKTKTKAISYADSVGPNSIGAQYKWNAARVQGMTAIIWQLAKTNGDTKTERAFARYWRKYESARLHHNYYGRQKPQWSFGHWSAPLDWHIAGPDRSGSEHIYSEAAMVKRGMIAAAP